MSEILEHYLVHPLVHALEHSLYTLPFLFLVYLLIEFIEHKAKDKLRGVLSDKRLGIPGAAALGLFPQCGFSVAASNLYSEGIISAGAAAAVFVATSDEALPIIASNPDSIRWLLPLILVKFGWAIVVGIVVNLIFHAIHLDHIEHHEPHHHTEHVHEGGEHHHCESCDSGRGIFTAAILRSIRIFLFIVFTAFILNVVIELLGEDRLSALLMTDSLLQPIIAAIIGLIPNCAASIVLSNLFVAGSLGFGSLAAGLSSGAGLGMLVLFRVNRSMRQNAAILGIVTAMSALLGIIIELIL